MPEMLYIYFDKMLTNFHEMTTLHIPMQSLARWPRDTVILILRYPKVFKPLDDKKTQNKQGSCQPWVYGPCLIKSSLRIAMCQLVLLPVTVQTLKRKLRYILWLQQTWEGRILCFYPIQYLLWYLTKGVLLAEKILHRHS